MKDWHIMKDWLNIDTSNPHNWTVTSLTEDGFMALIEIVERIQAGDDIELICIDLDLEIEAFRIFYAACNLLGAVDAVEQALKETA